MDILFSILWIYDSVAVWAIWDAVLYIWSGIVAFSQVIHIAKLYLLYSKGSRDLIETSLLYESIYIEYVKLWYDNRKDQRDEEVIEKRFNKIQQKEHAVDKRFKHLVCPEFKDLIAKSYNETNNFLINNFF